MLILNETTALNRAWMTYARGELARTSTEKYLTGEDIRFALEERGVHSPSHPNIWGLFIADLARKKLIRPTGGYAAMTDPSSHGRKTPIYTRVR